MGLVGWGATETTRVPVVAGKRVLLAHCVIMLLWCVLGRYF